MKFRFPAIRSESRLSRPLNHGGKLTVVTARQREGLDLIRHDAAHVVASVVQRLFPGTQVTIGPHTEDGFYYDFFRKEPFTPEDLEKIEKAANEEIRKDLPFVRKEVSREEALQLFEKLGEKFKVEIVEDIFSKGAKTLTLYSHGDWVDGLHEDPHRADVGNGGVQERILRNAVDRPLDLVAVVAPPVVAARLGVRFLEHCGNRRCGWLFIDRSSNGRGLLSRL